MKPISDNIFSFQTGAQPDVIKAAKSSTEKGGNIRFSKVLNNARLATDQNNSAPTTPASRAPEFFAADFPIVAGLPPAQPLELDLSGANPTVRPIQEGTRFTPATSQPVAGLPPAQPLQLDLNGQVSGNNLPETLTNAGADGSTEPRIPILDDTPRLELPEQIVLNDALPPPPGGFQILDVRALIADDDTPE